MRERKHYSPKQKVIIVRELLANNVSISQLAEKYQGASECEIRLYAQIKNLIPFSSFWVIDF